MLDSAKKTLRGKIINCVDEGNSKIESELDRLKSSLADTRMLLEEVANSVNSEHISSEYMLDSMCVCRKPRVLVLGYYGAKNLGDELMLQSLLKRLDRKDLSITIMLDNNRNIDASYYAPFNVLHYPTKTDDILKLAQNYDYIIWGGGAVLDDAWYGFNYAKICLSYILLKASIAAIKLKKKVFVLGVSTNKTLSDGALIKDLQCVIKGAEYFYLRDENSLKTLEKAGIDCSNVEIIDDLAISDLPAARYRKSDSNNDEINVGFSFLMNGDNIEAICKCIENVIRAARKEVPNKKVVINLIPFYSSNRPDSDEMFFERLISAGSLKTADRVIVHDFPCTIEELGDIITSCDCFITMRYHGALVSSMLGVKTLVVDFSNQHRHYFNKLDYLKKHYCDFDKIDFDKISDPLSINSAIKKLLNQKASPYSRDLIDLSDKTLVKILKQIN